MPGVFSAISFDSLAEDLRCTLAWIESLGIVTSPTRLAKYRKLMNEVIEVAELKDLERANAGYAQYVSALFEAHEIVQCWRGLADLPAEAFKERLRKTASGPTWYSDEVSKTSTNVARNTAFELLVTAQCARSGLTIHDERPADVTVSSACHFILIECKRPQSRDGLERVIKDAKHQLTRKLKEPQRIGSRGMVAIDLTKLANPQFGHLVTPSAGHARVLVERYVSDFIDHEYRAFNLARKPRIIAFLIRMSVIAECQDTSSLMYCQQWGLAALPDLSSRDRKVFDEVALLLGAVRPSWASANTGSHP